MIITQSQNSLYIDAGLNITFVSDSNVKYIEIFVDVFIHMYISPMIVQ